MNDADKLVALHEKLEEKDAKLDAAIASTKELESKLRKREGSKWTFLKSPAMLTALAGVLAGVGTTVENIMDRRDRRSTKEQEKTVDVKTQSAGLEYLREKQRIGEDLCILYADAIVSAMPRYQKSKVKSFLVDEEVPQEDWPQVLIEDSHEGHNHHPAPREPSHSTFSGETSPTVEIAPESAGSHSLYQVLQQQVSEGKSIDFEEVNKVLKKPSRMRKK